MGSTKNHHTSSMREAFSACLLGLGIAILSLSVGANQLKASEGAWRAACSGASINPLAGQLLAAAGGMILMAMVLGVYHGARGVYSVLRAMRYVPTCCSGSWAKLKHRLNTKPFLWQLALAFFLMLIFGCVSADLLIAASMNELQTPTAQACSGDGISASSGIIAGGVLGLCGSACSAALFLLSDVKERRKMKARQYLSSSFYNEDWQLSDDEGEGAEIQLPHKFVVEHKARSVKVKRPEPRDKRVQHLAEATAAAPVDLEGGSSSDREQGLAPTPASNSPSTG